MRHIISLKEQSKEDILKMLDMAIKLKENRAKGKMPAYLPQKTMIMLFEKTSTRTRLSFEAGMSELGGHAIFLDARTSQLSIGTEFKDEINAIMRYGQILMYRAKKATDVIEAASYNQIPVIDACSEKYHPAQALSDLLTMVENAGGVENIKKVTWLGIENNVSNTLMLTCTKLGIEFVIAAPGVNEPSVDNELNKMAEQTGLVTRTLDVEKAVSGADFVHTDTWIDMEFFQDGKVIPEFKDQYEERIKKFMPYQLNAELIDKYAPKAKIMHCMGCHIGYEISRDAVDHNNSVIYDQAENRMHMQKAMILWQLGIEEI
jgi:ornithine carbamoyltransferase